KGELTNWAATVCRFDKQYDETLITTNEDKYVAPVSKFGTTLGAHVFSEAGFQQYFGEDKTDYFPTDWSNDWLNMLLNYCHERRIPVVLLWLPVHYPNSTNSPTRDQHYEQLKAHYQQFADNKNVWLIDMHQTDRDPSHFRDPYHCNTAG